MREVLGLEKQQLSTDGTRVYPELARLLEEVVPPIGADARS
jgi:hypothetical protein